MSAHHRAPRWRVARSALVGALSACLALGSLGAAVAPAAAEPEPGAETGVVATDGSDGSAEALRDLRAASEGGIEVSREDGEVASVTSADGEAVLGTTARTPSGAAAEVLDDHGAVFGIDGEGSTAVVSQVLPSVTGGSVVRSQQEVDGVPVFGGQVVTVLDADRDVVSVDADTLRTDLELPAPRVLEAAAVEVAVGATARQRSVDPATLRGTSRGLTVFDPSVVGLDGPPVARQTWEVEVRDGGVVRQVVLVGADRGEVALSYDAAPRAGRWVCDQRGVADRPDGAPVPVCSTPALREGDSAGAGAAGAAYAHLGETVQTYDELVGVDLAELLGATQAAAGRLVATVNWCVTDDGGCPYENAFWNGEQIVLGAGFEAADDVVAHELTHGFVERTSNLFYFQQSGAINESMADVIGEIVDHRHGDEDTDWVVGEDLPAGWSRSMSDPAADGLPDRMTSPRWVDEHGAFGPDSGGVHTNLGVGNKTAYLISQGGTFGGRTVRGIDSGDRRLTKTGVLYLETIPQLTSGADYEDLGRVLAATCDRLVASGTAAFSIADCASVRAAALATELTSDPAVGPAPGRAPSTCPTGTSQVVVARDDDASLVGQTPRATDLALRGQPAQLVGRPGPGDVGQYAVSGKESLLLLDPDPSRPLDPRADPADTSAPREPAVVSAQSVPVQVPSAGSTFVHFHHAYSFDHDVDELGRPEGTAYDGGRLRVLVQQPNGSYADTGRLPWVNGPARQVVGSGTTPFLGFGGDSRGWATSRVDLTSLAGRTVRLQFEVEGDDSVAAYGWWLDDIRVFTCEAAPLTDAPARPAVTVSGSTATVRWQPPARRAAEVTGYRVTRSDTRATTTYPANARSAALGGLTGAGDVSFTVSAVGLDQRPGPATAPVRLESTSATTAASTARARRGQRFTVTGTVMDRDTRARQRGVRVTLQRLPAGSRTWSTVATSTTAADGTARWTVSQRAATSYRVVTTAAGQRMGVTAPARQVRMR